MPIYGTYAASGGGCDPERFNLIVTGSGVTWRRHHRVYPMVTPPCYAGARHNKVESLWVTSPAACGVSPIDGHLQTAIPRRLRRGSFIAGLCDARRDGLTLS